MMDKGCQNSSELKRKADSLDFLGKDMEKEGRYREAAMAKAEAAKTYESLTLFYHAARSYDKAARSLEKINLHKEAAQYRYRAAEIHERTGDVLNAARSYDSAAHNARVALARAESFDTSLGETEGMHRLNVKANLNSGRLYFREGSIPEAAYKWLYASIESKEMNEIDLAIVLSDMAVDLLDEEMDLPDVFKSILAEVMRPEPDENQ